MSATSGNNNNNKTTVVDFKELDATVQNLILKAIDARTYSYSPYSNFAVGACLECEDGTLVTGCNVENAVYGLTICAERTAMVKAISSGNRKFKSIAVIGEQENRFTTPCGSCRQFMSEFQKDMPVYITGPNLGNVLSTTVSDLLPSMFRFVD